MRYFDSSFVSLFEAVSGVVTLHLIYCFSL